jgi:hypothetical protein
MIARAYITSLAIFAFATGTGRVSAEEPSKRSWSSATFSHPIDYEQFQMLSVMGEDGKVYGEFWYNNFTDKDVPPPATISGTRMSDGTFWPDVALYVGNAREGEWKPLTPVKVSGETVSVIVPPTLCLANLEVDFSPFRPFLRTMKIGKAVLSNGETAYFDLLELLPPDERETHTNATPDT